MKIEKGQTTYITTFKGEIFTIKDKTPEEVYRMFDGKEFIKLQNGDIIKKSYINMIQSRESYIFQEDARERQKMGQYLKDGKWYDREGFVADALPEGTTHELLKAGV